MEKKVLLQKKRISWIGQSGEFPDKNNHTIDAARYGCEADIIQSKGRAGKNRARYEN